MQFKRTPHAYVLSGGWGLPLGHYAPLAPPCLRHCPPHIFDLESVTHKPRSQYLCWAVDVVSVG